MFESPAYAASGASAAGGAGGFFVTIFPLLHIVVNF